MELTIFEPVVDVVVVCVALLRLLRTVVAHQLLLMEGMREKWPVLSVKREPRDTLEMPLRAISEFTELH